MLIIDDEVLVRIGLKSMINWEEHNCELIGEASNGQLGLQLIKDYKPDIVITDIKMPVMDGLELIEKVLEDNIKTKFIVLSGYDEFHLVRHAMKLGVEDYLIKLELEPDVLVKILARIIEKINLDSKKKYNEYKIQKHIRINNYALREELFKKIISKTTTDRKDIDEELEYLDINLNDNKLLCLIINIEDTGKFKNYNQEDINILEFSIVNIVDEIVKDFFIGYTFRWTFKEYVIIFSCNDNFDKNMFKPKIEDMSKRIQLMLKQYFNICVSIGVSNLHESYNEISTAYSECCHAISQSFYMGREKIIFFSDIKSSEVKQYLNIYDSTHGLSKYIELNDIEAIQITFENIISALVKENISKEMAYDMCGQIAYLIYNSIDTEESNLQQIFGINKTVFDSILKLNSLSDMISWLNNIENSLINFLTRKENIQNNKIISISKRYISDNIGKTITLQDVASKINISTNYLSTIFKHITGMSFTDYVTEMKVAEAKRLLKNSNYKIYEIAQMTGYENAYYFSKVFKKITGITPSEFLSK